MGPFVDLVGLGRASGRYRRARMPRGGGCCLVVVGGNARPVRAPCGARRGLLSVGALVVGSGLDVSVLRRRILLRGLRRRFRDQPVGPEDVPGPFPPGLLPGVPPPGSPPPAFVLPLRRRRGGGMGSDLRPPVACFSCFFLGLRGHSHHACGPLIPRAAPKDPKGGVDAEGGRGRHCTLLLDLVCSQRLLGKKVMVQGVVFCGFPSNIIWESMYDTSSHPSLPDL